MVFKNKLLWILVLLAVYTVESYKVLLVYGFPVKSLSILGYGLSRHLLSAGHEVTYITAFPSSTIQAKYREIDISENQRYFAEVRNETSKISYVVKRSSNLIFDTETNQKTSQEIAMLTFMNENVQKLVNDTSEKFDVVISDYIETEIYAGLAALYQCPLIWTYSLGPNWISTRLVDESTNPAYTSDYLSMNMPPFTFLQRVQELWTQIKWKTIKRFKTLPLEEKAYKSIFTPLAKLHSVFLPEYEDIIYNASLVLSNDHFAFGNIPKLPQNYKLIGGFHIDSLVKPLPKNLQTLMDSASNGVIYFSMGSLWKSKDLPAVLRDQLIDMFGELNQTVIWKYEEELPNLPNNVHIIEWAPQQSILAHPNCRIFITHAGLLSSTESVHFSIPIIGIPVHYDQFININNAVKQGYAIKVNLDFDLASNLRKAIITMLFNSEYKQKAEDLSKIYHHRPIPPGREAVHWIEHVIITRGANHLKNPSIAIPFYQKMYLDLLVLVIVFIILIVYSFRYFVSQVKSKIKID